MDPALQKLKQDLADYLAMGGDTPVAPEAQALMDAIDQIGGDQGQDPMGAPDAGGMDAGADLQGDPNDPNAPNAYPPAVGGGDQAPSLSDTIPQDDVMPPPQHGAKTFEAARAGAKDRLKKLNKR